VVSITDDMMGGEWEQLVRHLRVTAGPWIQPRDMTYRLYALDKPAKAADTFESRNTLDALDRATRELEKAVMTYAQELNRWRNEIADFVAVVHQARTLAAQKPPERHPDDVAQEQIENLLAQSEIGLDRLGALYDIPKPRKYRTGS
jgi:hypothetical protein